jgi:FkbM family methyltransferase
MAPLPSTSSEPKSDKQPDGFACDASEANLSRAVHAGMRLQQLKVALFASPLAPGNNPIDHWTDNAPAPRHWLRTLGRRSLRLLRPLVLPLLHRFEWRVRTAVDKSSFATATDTRLRGLEARAAVLDASLARSIADTCQNRMELRAATRQNRTELRAALTEQNMRITATYQEATERVTALLGDLGHVLSRRTPVVPLADNDYLVRTPLGWLVAPGEDERLLMAMIETGGVLEPGTAAVLAALLRPGDMMIDVGAHIGTITIPAARAVGPGGQVIAVEPGARAAALLRRSLHINSLAPRVMLHDCAAGAANGEAMLHLTPVIGENSLISHSGDNASVCVTVRPLDDLVPPGSVRVVKIDAEGYELEVWQGMRRIISDNPELAVIVEFGPSHLARANIPVAEWFEALQAPGFTPWEIDELSGTIRALRPLAERSAIFSINLLLLRAPPSAYSGLRIS